MKYVLLFLAVLLAVFGGFALAAGFKTVFDGEAASLTAGAVALGCGIIGAGQVFILRALDALRVAIEQSGDLSAYARLQANEFDFASRGETAEPAVEPSVLVEPAPQSASLDFGVVQPAATAPVSPPPARFTAATRTARFDTKPAAREPEPSPSAEAADEPARAEAAPVAPRINTDLLLEAALATRSVPAQAEPPQRPAAATVGDFNLAPRTSPSLTEMWRRIAAKSEKTAAPVSNEPPPPPLTGPVAAAPSFETNDLTESSSANAIEPVEPDHRAAGEAENVQDATGEDTGHDSRDDVPGKIENAVAPPSSLELEFASLFGGAFASPEEPVSSPPIEEDQSALNQPTPAAKEPHLAALRPPADEPAEIGRYEADGTTYVMYADGSIEAQSDQGVYRFGSMAELKSFFEHQTAAQ